MHKGLPSLLDAIFGKQDLASVSLDEMYEVINEFPSFNAAHFLLAKKLKEQNDAAYDPESRRTALYFNNPFWLQTLLEEGNHNRHPGLETPVAKDKADSVYADKFYRDMTPDRREDELDEETEEILDEEAEEMRDEKAEEKPVQAQPVFQDQEPVAGTVTSFDELISKYHIETEEVIYEKLPAPETETISDRVEDAPPPAPETETVSDRMEDSPSPSEKHEPVIHEQEFETREEILNEYGIFEEVIVKKTDYDLEAFDRALEEVPDMLETGPAPTEALSIQPETITEPAETFSSQSDPIPEPVEAFSIQPETITSPIEREPAEEEIFLPETEQSDNSNSTIVENQIREDTPDKTDEHDYDAFDGPLEEAEPELTLAETPPEPEFSQPAEQADPADNSTPAVTQFGVQEEVLDVEMQGLADRIDEHRKAVAVFDAKNADSIVFAPYHMVDYFASQGIKLVLEDNPSDNLGKQLKSFTDWLKVMKKLPGQPASDKTDEREAERIRHFAAHSIEERDILTESMAEVLAKQGMYENAIALYQKLSLIYPPKSAYFASRIEQLKASLP